MLQTPGFVDRIDLPEDAAGRVALFTVAAPALPPTQLRPRRRSAVATTVTAWWRSAADEPVGVIAIGVAMVLVLVLGLLVTR